METMQPVAVKIGDGQAVNYQNQESHNALFQVGDTTSRDAGSHVSILVGVSQVVVSVWDGTTVKGTYIDRATGKVTDTQ